MCRPQIPRHLLGESGQHFRVSGLRVLGFGVRSSGVQWLRPGEPLGNPEPFGAAASAGRHLPAARHLRLRGPRHLPAPRGPRGTPGPVQARRSGRESTPECGPTGFSLRGQGGPCSCDSRAKAVHVAASILGFGAARLGRPPGSLDALVRRTPGPPQESGNEVFLTRARSLVEDAAAPWRCRVANVKRTRGFDLTVWRFAYGLIT